MTNILVINEESNVELCRLVSQHYHKSLRRDRRNPSGPYIDQRIDAPTRVSRQPNQLSRLASHLGQLDPRCQELQHCEYRRDGMCDTVDS